MRRVMLSCLAQASTAALIALVLAGAARADPIKDFFVSGTATNVSGGMLGSCPAGATCSFSGTMMVDVTSGTLETVHITFPGLLTFDTITGSSPYFIPNLWSLLASNLHKNDTLRLRFTTIHTPASLVDFAGGIIQHSEVVITQSEGTPIYRPLSGSITPVPEPSSLALLATGLIGLVGMARCKLKLGT